MKITEVLFALTLAFLLAAGANAVKVTIKSNCPRTIWPATLTGGPKGTPQLSTTGFKLQQGQSRLVDVPAAWSGRFWARTRCSGNPGQFTCKTGDCGSGQVECNGKSGVPPVTLVEIFTAAQQGGQDFYDVSNVDGFNIPASIVPRGGTGDCRQSTCPVNINPGCPAQFQVKDDSDGSVIGCKSACVKFNTDRYCCRNAYNKSETCPPTDYSRFFSKKCPQAYSYAYDDKKGTFTCFGPTGYLITFCP